VFRNTTATRHCQFGRITRYPSRSADGEHSHASLPMRRRSQVSTLHVAPAAANNNASGATM
jgi:hypothetical protein